jgi:hypothetical protein
MIQNELKQRLNSQVEMEISATFEAIARLKAVAEAVAAEAKSRPSWDAWASLTAAHEKIALALAHLGDLSEVKKLHIEW